jgi:hypothetical protein
MGFAENLRTFGKRGFREIDQDLERGDPSTRRREGSQLGSIFLA